MKASTKELSLLERNVLNHLEKIYSKYVEHNARIGNDQPLYGLIDYHNAMCRLYQEDPTWLSGAIRAGHAKDITKAIRPYYTDWLRDSNSDVAAAATEATEFAPNLERYLGLMKTEYVLFADYDYVRFFFARRMERKELTAA